MDQHEAAAAARRRATAALEENEFPTPRNAPRPPVVDPSAPLDELERLTADAAEVLEALENERTGLLATLETAKAERDAAFKAYDAKNTSPAALRPIEAATARTNAIQAKLDANSKDLERGRLAEQATRRAVLIRKANDARARAGLEGWRNTNAASIERMRELSRDFYTMLQALLSAPLDELERSYAEACEASVAAGLDPPLPVSQADVHSEVYRLLPGDLQGARVGVMARAEASLHESLLKRLQVLAWSGDAAGWDTLSPGQQRERLGSAMQDHNPETWARSPRNLHGRPCAFTPAEYAALIDACTRLGQEYDRRSLEDPLRDGGHVETNFPKRLAGLRSWPMHLRVRYLPKLPDARRMLRALKHGEVRELVKNGLPIHVVPADLVAKLQADATPEGWPHSGADP